MTEGQHPLRFSWRSFGLWVGLTTVGFILAGGSIHVQTDGTTAPFNLRDLNLSAAAVGFLFGCVTGLIIASLQWLSLRSWAPSARLWIPLNAIGFGLEHAFDDGMPYPPPFDQTAILVIGGVMIGLAQYIALRHTLSRAFLWVPVSAFAWFLGFKLGFAMLPFVAGNPLGEIALVFGSAGLTIGAVTGMATKLMVSDRTALSGRQLKPEKNKQWAK